ncbi:vanadium-dependent haloperoxidase [Patiriisocius hiemis]|uniref:Vanadium-dependent haloperoxidase n=1 Tax=Patiriisocius hiemis TaxID=3075604 RepID=A0ABU2YAP3_9FLAO|nr:vanadium-dependent haloperoxidase [Constantimarinum sp. W242]MDT0555256.1 vanadium-dependent haloperoxidase [Constantimarinum sp. W242]
MKTKAIKIFVVLVVLSAILQSCSNDDLKSDDEIQLISQTTELITQWNSQWLAIDRYTENMRPNTIARALAYIHLAGYETAVVDMNGYTSNSNRLQDFNIDFNRREDNVDLNLALNATYAKVAEHFMFSVTQNAIAEISTLYEENKIELSTGLSQSEIDNSINWGTYVAETVIAYSQTDSEAETQIIDPNPASYVPPVGDGLWIAGEGESAWFPYWESVRTFVIGSNETSSIAPDAEYSTETSSRYYTKMDEVNVICTTARLEDNEDLWIAEFWSDDVEGLMMSPPGRQFSIANQLILQEELDYEQTLELLLKLGFAINDAAVSAWADKYTYNTQRPSTYIIEYINEDFTTNLARFISSPNPAFPSYPSGHATFAGAAAGVFIDHFGGDTINFTDRTHETRSEFRGLSRSYSAFSEMAEENAYSRVPLGVHVQVDSDEGLRLGYEIAEAVSSYNLFN